MSYSSPFSKKFCGKSPISKELVGKQNRLPDHLKKAIEAAPEMKGSPNHKHGEKFRDQAKELSKDAEQGDYDYDNKKVTDLLAKAKAADARHVEEKKAMNNKTKVDSTKMAKKDPVDKKKTSGLNYGTPLHGSYQNADDYHYVSNAADFQKLQDSIVSGAKAAMTPENIGSYQAKRVEKRKKRKGGEANQSQKFKDKTDIIKKRSDDNLSDDVTNPCYNMKPGTIIGQGSSQITCP